MPVGDVGVFALQPWLQSLPAFLYFFFVCVMSDFPQTNKQTNTSFLGLNLHLVALSPLTHSHLLDPVDTILKDTHLGMLWLNLRVALVD